MYSNGAFLILKLPWGTYDKAKKDGIGSSWWKTFVALRHPCSSSRATLSQVLLHKFVKQAFHQQTCNQQINSQPVSIWFNEAAVSEAVCFHILASGEQTFRSSVLEEVYLQKLKDFGFTRAAHVTRFSEILSSGRLGVVPVQKGKTCQPSESKQRLSTKWTAQPYSLIDYGKSL